MARLRYNGLTATIDATGLTASATSIGFTAALSSMAGAVPTLAAGDYIPLTILTASGATSEIVYLTAYTSGATTGTISRGQEGSTGVAHASGDGVVHAPTTLDITGETAWTAATFQNAWSNVGGAYTTAAYRKDSSGVVHLKGLPKPGTMGAAIFTLPVGYRPAQQLFYNVIVNTGPVVIGSIEVFTDGSVKLTNPASGAAYASLDSISFYAA